METVTNDFSKVLTQVDVILRYLPSKSFDKIPVKIIERIEENKDNEYFFEYNFEKSLLDQNIFEETKDFLSAIYLNYICDENKKTEISKICKQNDEKHEQELVDKYNISKIFEKRKQDNYLEKQMEINTIRAYSEVDEILNLLEDKYAKRIPEKIRKFFREERESNYKLIIDVNKPLLEQNISREAMILLAVVYLNYLCDTEQEKQELLNEFAKNEEEKKELEEKYTPDNLFKNKNEINDEKHEELQIIEYKKQNFIQKIICKIIKMIKRK